MSAKSKSRSARWSDAATRALTAVQELQEMQAEFQEWFDNMPENFQSSPLGEKLETITSIDLDSAVSAVEEADGAEVPLGFGRD